MISSRVKDLETVFKQLSSNFTRNLGILNKTSFGLRILFDVVRDFITGSEKLLDVHHITVEFLVLINSKYLMRG